jgi:hypothetical protein
MAITFPRTIPDALSHRLASQTFTLKPMLEVTPLRHGRQIAADLGPSLWMLDWQSATVRSNVLGVARAWLDTLSSTKEFYGFDMYRQRPLVYAAGFPVGFTGACTLTSVSAPYGVVLGGLPAGLILSPGDYLSFDYNSGANRALHRIAAGGTASGGAVTLEVRPEIRSGYAGGAAVSLYRASARMLIIPDSYKETTDGRTGTVAFKAIQTL